MKEIFESYICFRFLPAIYRSTLELEYYEKEKGHEEDASYLFTFICHLTANALFGFIKTYLKFMFDTFEKNGGFFSEP